MSNETKRELFKALADDCAGLNDELYEGLLSKYDAALPDDLPVIPTAVGKYIRWCKDEGGVGNVSDAMNYAHGDFAAWLYYEHNSDAFAAAWILGVWRVEETREIVKLEAEE
ncbi:hypothetical protein EFT87_04115 [Schleiferilactobacillus harbinensis]|uniref:DUF1642 domain-containing protein n=1 Tax=Schleiferilactobacillus harbinensis TaxID=304207 RepID=UPI0021A4D919|nr:DUF1642 domain-containing protein [Schleiferilactobacillus harbinensis]MCT2907845.1 hypothetical protein [Schleiferilactobacillus harbinensis]